MEIQSSTRLVKRAFLITLATLAVGVSIIAFDIPTSSATSSSCTSGPYKTSYNGLHGYTAYCHTFRVAPLSVNLPGAVDEQVIGKMYVEKAWVLCQMPGRANPMTVNANGSLNSNNYWLLTQGDTWWSTATKAAFQRQNGWGWMPATYVSEGSSDSPVPGVASCEARR